MSSWLPSSDQIQRAAVAASNAASSAASQAKKIAIDKGFLAPAQPCAMCTWQNYPGVEQCLVCHLWICAEHVKVCPPVRKTTDKYSIPQELLPKPKNPDEKSMKERIMGDSTRQFICGLQCKHKCSQLWMQKYTREMATTMRVEKLMLWIEECRCNIVQMASHFAYSIPDQAKDDFNKRAWIASYKIAKSGVGMLLGTYGEVAMNAFVYGTEAMSFMTYLKGIFGLDANMFDLIANLSSIMLPKMHQLQAIAREKDPTKAAKKGKFSADAYLAASVFYLSSEHNLNRIMQQKAIADSLESNPTVSVCPNELLDKIGHCLDKAQWLYSTHIPGIYNTPAWTEWFLGRVLLREGWTLVGCNLENTLVPCSEHILPNGQVEDALCNPQVNIIAPCFAVAIRVLPGGKKEAVLCIRGTKTGGDVLIDLDHEPANAKLIIVDATGSIREINGHVHAGMLRGAQCMLEYCHVYSILDGLIGAGFDIQIVGHSLGAGVASIAAMLLHNKYIDEVHTAKTRSAMPAIECIGFGMPAVASEEIASALASGCIVTAVVNHYDIVPRLSWQNMMGLAVELGEFQDMASAELDRDMASYKAYAKSLGAASRRGGSGDALSDLDSGLQAEAQNADVDRVMAELDLSPTAARQQQDQGSGQPPSSALKEHIRLVPPGRIIYLHDTDGGVMEAYCTDHTLPLLREIKLMSDCVLDHYNKSYFAVLRTLRHARVTAGTMSRALPIRLEQSLRIAPLKDPATGNWNPCSVCREDTTWPYICKSSSARAGATHHCKACGSIVCSVCAPAGDSIPDDGLNQYVSVDDLRIPLPLMGLITPQRVCLPCFFKSYSY